jgi:L-malate glycosyltransferase
MRILLIDSPPELIAYLGAMPGVELSWLASQDLVDRQQELGWPGKAYLYPSQLAKVDPRAIGAVRRAVQAEKPDLIHAFYGRALAHAALAVTGLSCRPKIVSFRGITSRLNRFDLGDWVSYLHPSVDAHACESLAVEQAMVNSGIAPDKCCTVYNFARLPAAESMNHRHLLPREIPQDAFVVGMVANMRRVKGADILLQAAGQLLDLSDMHWILVGHLRDRRVTKLLADPRLRGRVHAVGYRSDARQWMSAFDLFVMPSRREALCRALLEAMALGICPVVSDAGGLPELVRNQQDGLVVPRENPAALARAMRHLCSDTELRANYGRSAALRLANDFNVHTWCQRLGVLYQRVLHGENLKSHNSRPPAATPNDRKAA